MIDEIKNILKNQDFAYHVFYDDSQELNNYKERGSYFYDLDTPKALIKTTENALEHGLTAEKIKEYLENSSAWSVLSYEDKNKILNHFNAQNSEVSGDNKEPDKYISYPLSESTDICYDEYSHEFFTFSPFSKNPVKNHIIRIPIKFMGLVIDDNEHKFINAIINGNTGYFSLEDFKNELKTYAITGTHLEQIMQFLLACVNDQNNLKNVKYIHPDGIYIDEGNVIRTDNSYKIELESTLETIYKIYEISTSPNNFLINFAYYLISPLSYYIRKQNKLFPYLINAGPHQTGKTSDMLLFGNLGYAQDFLKSHFTRNDLKTFYTLMKSRSESILPITLEDVDIDWIRSQATMLKGSAGTINGGSRGYFNRVIKYESKSQLTFDTNDTVDVETAQLDRFIVCNFNVDDINRINIAKFDELKGKLNPGFMFIIFDAVFGGKNLDEVIKELYNVRNRDSLKINIINYVVSKINLIMPNNMQFKIPDFSLIYNENNETDWYAEIYNTGKYICSQFNLEEKVHIYELNETQIDFDEKSLYITAGGYLLLQKHLNIPYKSITKLYNNSESKDFTVKFTSHRFAGDDNHPLKCLIITPIESNDLPEIREIKEEIARLEEIKKKLNANNIDTEGINKTIDDLNAKIESIKNSLEKNKANNQEENKTGENGKNNNEEIKTENTGGKEIETKTENNTSIDNDIENLPDGPVKESLIEEREELEHKNDDSVRVRILKDLPIMAHLGVDYRLHENDILYIPASLANVLSAQGACVFIGNGTHDQTETTPETPKQEPESEHASKIMDYRYNNKDSETLYYRLNKDFNKFDGAFFYGSSIIVDSIRNIRVPGTSEIAYVLYKLRIPKHATDSDYPKGWLSFTTSAEPLNEKAYNALSKGDQK